MSCKNVGGIDRMARIAVGLILLGLVAASVIGLWGLIGLIPLATGGFGFCPLYKPLGINTCGCCGKDECKKTE